MSSKVVAGRNEVPNPRFNKLQMEMRRAERELNRALAEAERGFQMSQCYSCGLVTQWGGVALQKKWQTRAKELQNQITRLTNEYADTPEYLSKEILRSYNYVVQNVEAKKSAIFKIIQSNNKKYLEKQVVVDENKDFKIAYNINPNDKNYESLLNKYNLKEDLANWQNQKIQNISIKSFIDKINEQQSFKEINGTKQLYASLNLGKESGGSLFGSLFDFNKKKNKKKSNSLSKSKYETKDKRFDSVVVIKTEEGMGSGFYVSSNEILTNYHVVEGAMNITITDRYKKKSSAVLIKKDLKRDLALLKTNLSGNPVNFYSGQLQQGEMVEALGHPKGRKFSLTKGWVSAIRKESSTYEASNQKNVLFIQTDAAINPGNSGGPLFYKNRVVGVNTQGLSKEVSEGMNFAVHFSEVEKFLSE